MRERGFCGGKFYSGSVSDTSSVFVENTNTVTPGLLLIMGFNSAMDGATYSCTVGSVSANMMINPCGCDCVWV